MNPSVKRLLVKLLIRGVKRIVAYLEARLMQRQRAKFA
jgi:hypothetical protein